MAAAVLAAATLLGSTQTVAQAADIPTSQEAFASCVSHRESRNDPTATSSISSSAGKWQFLQSSWGSSLPWMVAARLRQFGMSRTDAQAIRKHLHATPIHQWSEALQDVAFLAVLNAGGKWSGWRHWYLAGSKCNSLVPAIEAIGGER